jgi:hypothetical protein
MVTRPAASHNMLSYLCPQLLCKLPFHSRQPATDCGDRASSVGIVPHAERGLCNKSFLHEQYECALSSAPEHALYGALRRKGHAVFHARQHPLTIVDSCLYQKGTLGQRTGSPKQIDGSWPSLALAASKMIYTGIKFGHCFNGLLFQRFVSLDSIWLAHCRKQEDQENAI